MSLNCPRCSTPLPENSRYCLSCGSPVESPSVSPTQTHTHPGRGSAAGAGTSPLPSPSSRAGWKGSSGSFPGERFAPGTVLAERYRIAGPAGRGGMGEVYRADDLKLGQPVALKFLPESLSRDEGRLARLLDEVRIARQVSHPNVCRVYDAGEADGHHFLSMEFVDGEDLATLIRRIGRLAPDKGTEIARQICAGLAAAHERGVVHRDLKPANVMIDGRGKVRLTDFGLAGLAEDPRGLQGRSGTPAYMAPEQLEGEDATVRTDLYALGLVLYELFTGRQAFRGASSLEELRRMRQESDLPSPSTLVSDLDPAVERVILRCLEPDPRSRPASALAVAAALPGGDPLAAALAAGETPSPEMVAAAGEEGTLSPAVGLTCLAGFLAGMVLLIAVADRTSLFRKVPFDLTPDVLADRAGQVIRAAGYAEPPADRAWGLAEYPAYLQYVLEHDSSPGRWDPLARGVGPGILFWYRQSPREMVPVQSDGRVNLQDPPSDLSGMTLLQLDSRGRLLYLERVPPQVPPAGAASVQEPDWPALFREAGLDIGSFTPRDPSWVPPFHADRRMAWEGAAPDLPAVPLRVEAASFQGKPVYFQTIHPWTKPRRMEPPQEGRGVRWATNFLILLVILVLIAGILSVRYNIKMGRGDRRGALRISAYAFLTVLVFWVLSADHVASMVEEYKMFQKALAIGLYIGGILWLAYMALEPSIRRHWPEILVGWSRLMTGRWRDPRVGRDVLAGALAGVAVSLLVSLDWFIQVWMGRPSPRPGPVTLDMFLGGSLFTAATLISIVSAVLNTMGIVALIFVVMFLVRRRWLAAGIVWIILTALFTAAAGTDLPILDAAVYGLSLGLCVVLLFRFGLLTLIIAHFLCFQTFPLSLNLPAWYRNYSLLSALLLAAPAIYGYLVSRRRHSPRADWTPRIS